MLDKTDKSVLIEDNQKTTHEKLDISFAELGALLGARALLRDYVIKHATEESYDWDEDKLGDRHVFNMGIACVANKNCGSVSCIGGTMGQIMGMSPDKAEDYTWAASRENRPIGELFFPPEEYSYDKITSEQAIQAIDNFIDYADPKWEEILTEDQKFPD